MCIGIPMQVISTDPGHAHCAGRGQTRRVRTALVGDAVPGEWLLVFIDSAQERIGAPRAAEINATLDLLQAAMSGDLDPPDRDTPVTFDLPSRMSTAQLRALCGGSPHPRHREPSMSIEASSTQTLIKLPVQPPKAPTATSALIERLVDQFGASWVDETSIDAWAAVGGDRVVLFAGDPVQFPEGLDVAVVLPELQRSLPGRFVVGVVRREREDTLARRFGSQRWPTLLFLRDGQYVTTVSGMHDWDVFIERVSQALSMPISRAPTIGIPVISATTVGTSCH